MTGEDLYDAPASKGMAVFMLLAALGFVGGGVWVIADSAGGPEATGGTVLGLLVIIAFGTFALKALRYLLMPAALTLGPGGLVLRTGLFPFGPVAWEEVAALSLYTQVARGGPKTYVAVHLRDPSASLGRRGWTRRLGARLNRLFGHPDLCVSGMMLKPAPEAVLEAARRYAPATVEIRLD